MSADKLKGGEFLLTDTDPESVFIPEEITEEQKMIRDMAKEFLDAEVFPKLDAIDALEDGLMNSIMSKAGEMGLLGITIPEQYGGFGKSFTTGVIAAEVVGGGHSFAVAQAAHTGIGALPILYFGNEEQKKTYLPKLSNGEWKASYCLTEPGSGSDALAAKSKAVLSDDKSHFVLNGQKMWITNAGFADVFIVFAQVDPKGISNGKSGFTGFIVEKGMEGISLGNEEHKMGIKGSSTRQVFFSDCKVPIANVLGEIGEGHKIAFNILNIGRIKLAVATLGGAKLSIKHAAKYAEERKQFKTSISNFGAIKHKLAEQAIKIWVLESATYRLSALVDNEKAAQMEAGAEYSSAVLNAAEEYAIEAALIKVLGSETLDFVVDESVQIFGGYGFSEEYPVSRGYRDSRINRIFEGTNEINRLLSVDMLLKRVMKGKLDLIGKAKGIQAELTSIPSFDSPSGVLAKETQRVEQFKKTFLLCGASAAQALMQTLENEQEIIMDLADIMLICFAAESALLRTKKLIQKNGEEACALQIDMLRCYLQEAGFEVEKHAKRSVMSWADGDNLKLILMGIKRYSKTEVFNAKEARRRISEKVVSEGKYCF